jgi:membrane-associated phospholipid phosphatase
MPELYRHDPFLGVHQALQSRWLDLPMAIASTACEGWALALAAAVVLAAVEGERRRFFAAMLPLGLALAASGFAVQELKDLWCTPRPLSVYGPGQVRIGMEPLFLFGFPSGHASAAATFATCLVLSYGSRARLALLVPAFGGLSRVYVGAHWVTDVLGGFALGATLGGMAYAVAIWGWPDGHLARLRAARRAARPWRLAAPEVAAARGGGPAPVEELPRGR